MFYERIFLSQTDGRVSADASLKVSETKTFTASIEDGRQEPGKPLQSYGKLGLDFLSSGTSLKADIDIVNGPILSGSILSRYGPFRIGGEAFLNTHLEERDQKPEVTDANIGVSYDGPDWTASLRTIDLLGSVRLGYVHNISKDIDVGGLVEYRIRTNYQSMVVGARWR